MDIDGENTSDFEDDNNNIDHWKAKYKFTSALSIIEDLKKKINKSNRKISPEL